MVADIVNPAIAAATTAQRAAARPDISAWVEANAGSGKTKVLADRVLALLLQDAPPERILCLTYTRAAAAEMRIRIDRELAEWSIAADDDLRRALTRLGAGAADADMQDRARRLFARIVDAPAGLRIDTIHAFCQAVLGRFPLEAGVSPWFQLADERDALSLQARARDRVLEHGDIAVLEAVSEIAGNLPERSVRPFIAELLTNSDALEPGARTPLEGHLSPSPASPDQRAALTIRASKAALALGRAVDGDYRALKRRAGLLDYDDLIERALNLLRAYPAAWVHYKLDRGIDHVLIDEAQDTSPDQWALIEALTAEFFAGEGAAEGPRTVFAVGDPKQSIYRFQGAEPARFNEMRNRFDKWARAGGQEFRSVGLEVSFRAAPILLEAVDAVFAGDDGIDLGLGETTPAHRASRSSAGGRLEVWPLESTGAQNAGDPFEPPRENRPDASSETRLADRVARRIAAWLKRGEPVAPGGQPMRPGDIVILLPRRKDRPFIPRVIVALKQAGVPVAGIDRMTLEAELAVMDLAAIGDFVLLPEDDLTLATVLKGPLFGFDDEALFALAHGRKGALWAALGARRETERFGPCFEALGALLGKADHVGVHAFFAGLLAEGGLRRRIAARLGEEANDPIDEFLNAALDYERRHPPSLQGFLHWLRSGEAEVKRQLDQRDRDEVRVSTVHGAKGLEAPVVILPDTTGRRTAQSDPHLLRDSDRLLWPPEKARDAIDPVSGTLLERIRRQDGEERRRLLYVAMTRAADRLVVCGWSNGGRRLPDDCWYHVVRNRLQDRLTPEEDPDFDEPLLVMERRAAESEAEGPPGNRESLPPLPGWARRPAPPLPIVALPDGGDEPFPAAAPLRGKSAGRFRRGRAVHKLLELLPGIAPDRRPEAARRFLASEPGLADDAGATVREVLAVLDDPAFRRVFGPGSRAEAPLVGRLGGETVSARIDRLALLADETLIVDFKSGRAPPAAPADAPAAYLRQLARYVALLRRMRPDRPVRAALLWTEAPLLMPVPESCLAPYMP